MQFETFNTVNVISGYIKRQEICRLCGKMSQNFVSIFEENNLYIAEKISTCLPIIVLSTDKLPSHICKHCLHNLNISYKLIITSLEVDTLLRKQLNANETETIERTVDTEPVKSANTVSSKPARVVSLKELKKRAIAGPAECDMCGIIFQDIDAFDNHMETIHILAWRCNLCDNSFQTSAELISHKKLMHDANVVMCESCTGTEEKSDESNIITQDIMNCSKVEVQMENESQCQTETTKVQCELGASVEVEDLKPKQPKKKHRVLKTARNRNQNFKKSKIDKRRKDCTLFCDICNICFGDEHHFFAHKKIHESKSIACLSCDTECSSIYDLFLHKRAEHSMYKKVQLKYVCDKCEKFFTNSWQWESHKGNNCQKKISEILCKYCKTIFSTNHKLMRHLRKHKSEMFNDPTVTIYKCVACPKVFVDKEFYQKHRNVHDPECWDKFKCTSCNRSFRDNVRLREHQLSIHEGIKPHQCDICGRTFHRSYNMKVHRLTHFSKKCSYCDKTLKRMQDLVKHIRDDHGIEPDIKRISSKTTCISNSYVCRYCGKKLASYQSLINHEYIHTGEKPYSCKICHKTFRSYTSRWAHVQRHKKGNFVCEHCGKCFSYKQNLSVHVQTHLPIEDRKHQCSICNKRFLRKCHLNIHMRIHDGIRPYTCDICFFSFTQKGDMRRHRLRHSKGNIRVRSPRCKSTEATKSEQVNRIEEST